MTPIEIGFFIAGIVVGLAILYGIAIYNGKQEEKDFIEFMKRMDNPKKVSKEEYESAMESYKKFGFE